MAPRVGQVGVRGGAVDAVAVAVASAIAVAVAVAGSAIPIGAGRDGRPRRPQQPVGHPTVAGGLARRASGHRRGAVAVAPDGGGRPLNRQAWTPKIGRGRVSSWGRGGERPFTGDTDTLFSLCCDAP